MSIRVSGKTLRNTVAIAAILAASSGLAGCSSLGLGGDDIATGSTGYQGTSNLSQPMPAAVGASTQVADGPYIPPEDIGSGSPPPMLGRSAGGGGFASLPPASSSSSISSQDLPVLGSAPSNGSYSAMSAQPAQQPFPPASAAPRTEPSRLEALRSEPARPVTAVMTAPPPSLSVIPGGSGTYTHVIRSGESLYTIARHYGVTAQAIMQASNIGAPDKIHVGQRVVIPGRADLLAAMDSKPSPESAAKLPVDSATPVVRQAAADVVPAPHRPAQAAEVKLASLDKSPAVPLAPRASVPLPPAQNTLTGKTSAALPPVAKPAAAPAAAPAQIASAPAAAPKMPLQEPAMSGADKFRWPVTGKVITNFTASHETGINIAAPEGTPVKAAENGTVIYVGSGVEGYGNLVLIRHANGYVSAYANLKDMSVAKGAVVARGDTIGSTGATGAVSSPQLHFELRKGATPVDPVPLLAG
ncbi:MAG TPA: peptidoglycan DD-metalloendopeptidase family protein [Devosia sp.]|nr:peptidoglycan DD-metalloendopeptidase family protein [Devosia sp.]